MVNVIPDILLDAAMKHPQKDAVFFGHAKMNYQAVLDQSVKLAHALIDEGVKKGDRVCLFLEKRFEKVIAIFGISICGGVFVPIRRLLRPSQAAYIINHCDAKVLITTASRARSLFVEAKKIPSVKTVILLEELDGGTALPDVRVIEW
jgi:acyl-CoA synthetase (AMP-forming)/AMP-acid ligase II